MARYIDADKLMEQVTKKKSEVAQARYTDGFNDAIMRVRSMIHSATTANVAPRADVAREIFEEVERIVNFALCVDIMEWSAFADLKKKYESEGAEGVQEEKR